MAVAATLTAALAAALIGVAASRRGRWFLATLAGTTVLAETTAAVYLLLTPHVVRLTTP